MVRLIIARGRESLITCGNAEVLLENQTEKADAQRNLHTLINWNSKDVRVVFEFNKGDYKIAGSCRIKTHEKNLYKTIFRHGTTTRGLMDLSTFLSLPLKLGRFRAFVKGYSNVSVYGNRKLFKLTLFTLSNRVL